MQKQYKFQIKYTNGSTMSRFMTTPPPKDPFFHQVKVFYEDEKPISELPSIETIKEMKGQNIFNGKDKEYWNILFFCIYNGYIIDRRNQLHKQYVFNNKEKEHVKIFLLNFSDSKNLRTSFFRLFCQFGELDMLKWMYNHDPDIDMSKKQTNGYISMPYLDPLEISIIEGHLKVALWLKNTFNFEEIKYSSVVLNCYFKKNKMPNIQIISHVSDKIFSESEISDIEKKIMERYISSPYIVDDTQECKKIYQTLKKYLRNTQN